MVKYPGYEELEQKINDLGIFTNLLRIYPSEADKNRKIPQWRGSLVFQNTVGGQCKFRINVFQV